MDALASLGQGFSLALQPINLLYCALGVTVGTLIGVLPGVGPASGIALLIPFTFGHDPVSALILLCGIYYGAMYGGSTTSILANIPGESSSVMTAVEGFEMTKQGRGGAALGIAAFGSFIAGTLGVVALMAFAPSLARVAISFGEPEYFAVMVAAFCLVSALTGKSVVKGLISTVLGLLLSLVGIDPVSGIARFTAGRIELLDGISFLVVAIGIFAVAEIFENVETLLSPVPRFTRMSFRQMLPNLEEWRRSIWPILRGTVIGFFTGVLPGAGATIASFLSYAVEKSVSRHPERFGKGAIEGVAGPESANNAASAGSLVPMLTLGIPGSGSTAIMMGALMMLNVTPGPLLFREHPQVFWGLVASMYIGNVMLLALNLPLIGAFVQVLRIPYSTLSAVILALSCVGVFSLNYSLSDVWLMFIFGLVGYAMRKLEFPMPPMVLALVLGTRTERSLRLSLLLSDGSPAIFFTRPIPLAIFVAVALYFLYRGWRSLRARPVQA